jgi:iron complex outermembrane receptor protein
MTVTGTREKALLSETPVSIGAIKPEVIRETAPMHPGQLLGQVPGVAIAVTNGEGHTTAIRQPFTTSPLYLFLEDGIPIRATGFFNHNALYEVNIPMAGGIEVVRGPGTALYGSDAIGGIVNILSHAPTGETRMSLSGEAGTFGTWRFLGSGTTAVNERGGLQVDLNVTHTDGWRQRTAYDRQSGNLRFDQRIGREWHAQDDHRRLQDRPADGRKLRAATGRLPQQSHAQQSLDRLPQGQRRAHLRRVRTAIRHRHDLGHSLLPRQCDGAQRHVQSELRPAHREIPQCLLRRAREVAKNLPVLRARLIGGLDLDYSPGSRREDNLLVTRTGTGANTVYTGYTIGTRIYDYRVTFRSASPYVHTELSPTRALRLTAGLRYDALRYTMQNRLSAGTVQASVLGANRFYGQLADDQTSFSRLSPKLGATYALNPHLHAYASYNFGFRAPSEGQLYRAGNDTTAVNALSRARLAVGLKPIKASQIELGFRGDAGAWSYNVVAYELEKKDDLVGQRDLATNVSTNVNAGRTEHRGIEAGIGARLGSQLRFDTALSYARHRYVKWITATANFSGRNIETAPKVLANTRLTWRPVAAAMLQLEWVRIGEYWLEASNSANFGQYPGHDLLHVRASYAVGKNLGLFARVMNATDKRFADSASVSSNTPVFSPGLPRAFYGGVEFKW